jgi:nicotinamidase-related amidase
MHQELQDRGGRTVLLVIDVQIAVVKDGFDSDVVDNRIGKVIEAAREASVPVV